jgi:ABC-type transport system involved in multi-copper enzyme maturation permease subunit
MILSKAVARHTFFLAKFAGVVMVVAFFCFCLWLAAILSTRVGPGHYMADEHVAAVVLAAVVAAYAVAGVLNYRFRRPFCSTACGCLVLSLCVALGFVARWPGEYPVAPLAEAAAQFGPAVLLIGLGLVAMAAIAISLAARLSLTPVMSICALLFLGGLISDHLAAQASGMPVVAVVLHAILPNWQHFWVADAVTGGGGIPGRYVAFAALYAGLYTGGVLCAGAAAFAGREVK